MIIYNLTTKTTKDMYVDDYIKWMQGQADSIQILPIRRDGYTPVISMYKNKKHVGYHAVTMSQSEVDALNSLLPKMRADRSFNISKIKV